MCLSVSLGNADVLHDQRVVCGFDVCCLAFLVVCLREEKVSCVEKKGWVNCIFMLNTTAISNYVFPFMN